MERNTQKIKVGLVQINNSFSGQNYLPYSVATLQAYAEKNLKNLDAYEFLLPVYHRIRVEEAAQQLMSADAVFFSTYVWNIRISLEIARTLKARRPDILIVFGGPQVPDRVESFIRKHEFIDMTCHNEGERIFVAILENMQSGNFDNVPGISFLRDDGTLVQNPRPERLKDLNTYPSPFLDGTFASLMEKNPQEKWIVLWETNRGCPFSCTFCDWGSSTQSKVFQFPMERLTKEIEWFAEHKIEYVFCADANFGMLPRDLDIVSYVAETKRKYGYPQAMSVQNTKNATERAYKVQKLLSDEGLNKGVTISFQSVDKETLTSIKRANISTESFHELQRRFSKDKVETYTDLILGLPGETYDSFANGVSLLIENGQHNRIQFNNLSILPNAEMGDPEYQKKHGMVTVETKLINIHGSLSDADNGEIYEMQDLVISTGSLSRKDWVRTRAFAWMAALLHFDKILQIPFILLHTSCSVSYRELIEVFSEGDLKSYPVLSQVRSFFLDKAMDIQNGGPEYCESKEWLNIWWPADEYVFIKLSVENKLGEFYAEAEKILRSYLESKFMDLSSNLLHEAVELNRHMIKQPLQSEDLDIELSYNIWEFYRSVVEGSPIPLLQCKSHYHIDRTTTKWLSWDAWCQEVVWYGNKKGAYLYGNSPVNYQMAGHF